MVQLVRDMEQGRATGFTLDGPRGPARVAQPGGNPVLPFHLEASSHWTMKSWDATQIPKPFSTVALAVGEPLAIARESPDESLGAYREELERRLRALEARAHEMLR
jgi:lysophospholipid acyltransferase (LPLAT)-like uncharacterized protein